jgi:hypothetical protein
LVCQDAILNIRPISMLAKVFAGLAGLLCRMAENYISQLSQDLMVIGAASTNLSVDNPNIQRVLSNLEVL